MKKNFLFLTLPLGLFLHLYFLQRYFHFKFPFWNINLLFCFELAVTLLGLAWVLYSTIISKLFNIDFKEVLKKDLYTYYPLFLLLFYFVNHYTNYRISNLFLGITTLFLIIILKVAVVLDIKAKVHKNYVYLLASFAIILPIAIINYFGFSFNYSGQHTTTHRPELSRLKNLYTADPLPLFSNELSGAYKKKIRVASEIRNALVLLPPMRIEATVNVPAESYLQFGFGAWEKSYPGEGDGIQFNSTLST